MRSAPVATLRLCPICGERLAQRIWHEATFDYVRCTTCGGFFSDLEEGRYEALRHNVWDDQRPTADALGFYGEARVRAHEAFLARTSDRPPGRLLDIGCGLGFFLERAATHGWDCWGCEPSSSWARVAEHRIGPGRVFETRIEELEDVGQFDLITAWDVLEHVFQPLAFLRRVEQLLAPGGRVFLRTPNLSYVLPIYRIRRRFGHTVELGPVNHVVYFTRATLERALHICGLAPERWLHLPPPQVDTFRDNDTARYAPHRSVVVAAKNAWAAGADALGSATKGRVSIGSDLDVIARRSTEPVPG
jgi:SAM-dependent methyltransferase